MTRGLALVPALVVIGVFGEEKTGKLLVTSQVILSMQLPFAMIPLLVLAGDPEKMGALVSSHWMRVAGWASAVAIVLANAVLVATLMR